MSKTVYLKYFISYFENINIDIHFKYNNSIIFSIQKNRTENELVKLIIVSKCEIEDYDSIIEANRLCRGDILVLQGIFSFFTGFPLTVYNNIGNCSQCDYDADFEEYKNKKFHLIIDSTDYTSDLIKLLKKIELEEKLIVTLLDR